MFPSNKERKTMTVKSRYIYSPNNSTEAKDGGI